MAKRGLQPTEVEMEEPQPVVMALYQLPAKQSVRLLVNLIEPGRCTEVRIKMTAPCGIYLTFLGDQALNGHLERKVYQHFKRFRCR